ncbi:MAG: peptidase S41 [Bacteroidales bacterium]|nr:peptidase S41 [Bacteroidales bacterium]MBR5862069.1 peptidase S41 [Bacteroidales bacterium]
MKSLYAFLLAGLLMAVSCTKNPEPDPIPDQSGQTQPAISNVNNPYAKKHVSFRGGTVTVKFDAELDWTASVKMDPELDEPWVEVMESTLSGTAKKGASVRLVFEKNGTSEERVAELWVAVQDQAPECIATLTQAASGTSVDAKINAALNNYMHDILKEDYLFKDAYNAQEIDLTVNYGDFLGRHLLSLGEANIEDGGYYRSSQSNAGERFIYTNLVEVQIGTKAIQTNGLGFGPFLSTPLENGSSYIGIAPGFVRRGSPAEAAGLRRGDIIYAVNGTQLTTGNYYNMMTTLYVNPSGTYKFSFLRFEDNGRGGYDFNAYESGAATAAPYVYDPVLHASVMTDPDNASTKIGYLVYESFDLNSQEFLESAVNGFIEEGITDLILDLRFNAGGAVAQSRWLSGCIAGEANGKKTFVKVIYNDDKTENWTFDYGYTNETDPLGKPKDLGLDRLFVITSYNTASAAELVISSLKGIDFPVKMIGCNTEGKNVGMVVSETSYNGRRFQFSPVTFWVKNAKDWGDYGFGMKPDEYVNNDNTNFEDDADNAFPYSFSDWGNMDFNIALQWAYCDITGKPRWNTKDTEVLSLTSAAPMQAQQVVLENGRYGNLRFNNK